MDDIAFSWAGQPDIARDFLRILFLLFLLSIGYLANRLIRIRRGNSIRPVVPAKDEAPDAVYTHLRAAKDTFSRLDETTEADIRLMKLACVLLVLLSLAMVGCSASSVYHEYLSLPRLQYGEIILLSAVQLLELLGVGLTLSTALYAATIASEWLLQRRKVKLRQLVLEAERVVSEPGREGQSGL